MKKLKILLTTLFLFLIANSLENTFASENSMLISVGTADKAITVYSETTIGEIEAVLGPAKIKTDSAYGGYAYTFYTDDNYSNYLYIETTKAGKIISYGSVDKTYRTSTYSYGDEFPFRENKPLSGCLFTDDHLLKGGIYYNKEALYATTPEYQRYTQIINFFQRNYASNTTKYLRGISEHAVTMYNALSTALGNKVSLKFDEDMFYINEQFKEFGSSISEYLRNMDKTTLFSKGIGTKSNIELNVDNCYTLNPLQFASLAVNNLSTKFDERNIAIFDYNYGKKTISAIAIRPNTFDLIDSVDLTPEEQSKLSSGRYEYNEAIRLLNSTSNIFDITPKTSSASGLLAGKLNKNIALGITSYLNAVRVAGGGSKLSYNEEAFNIAQHKSTLLTYRFKELGLQITHAPQKPSGVSDTFYNTAMGNGKTLAECIGFIANPALTTDLIKYELSIFLDDRGDEDRNYSHRQVLLDNSYTDFGYGISEYVFSSIFMGNKASNNELEAWPVKGITFLETLYNNRFEWTAQFVDKYTIQDTTTATITCLNTGKSWEFNNEGTTSNSTFTRNTNSRSATGNRIVMYHSDIVAQAGYVYQVTLHNVKEDSTGRNIDYTYRSAFEYADVNNYPSKLDSIEIRVPDDLAKVEGENIYYIPIGEEVKLNVIVDQSIIDNKISWVSSNENISVSQNGTVFATGEPGEEATITATYSGSNVTSQIVVRTYKKIETVGVTPEKASLEIDKDAKDPQLKLEVTYVPTDANDIKVVTWKVASLSNLDIEYDINDPEITKYIEVKVDPNNQKIAYVNARGSEEDNNQYKVIAHIRGISGDYTGSCTLTLGIQISSITIKSAMSDINYSSAVNRSLILDWDKIEANHSDGIITLEAEISPNNANLDRDIVWSTGNSDILESLGNGRFKIKNGGSTTITAAASSGSAKTTINFVLSVKLKGLMPGTTQDFYISDNVEDNKYVLKPVTIPQMAKANLRFESLDKGIASVTANGEITFYKTGTVQIKVYNADDVSMVAYYTFNVHQRVSDIAFSKAEQINVTLSKGEVYSNVATTIPDKQFSDKISYSSTNPSIATVDNTGVVRAISGGNTIIRASISGEYTATGKEIVKEYYVYVAVPLTDINVPTKRSLISDTLYTLDIQKVPADTTDRIIEISCVSEDDSVLKVVDIDKVSGKIELMAGQVGNTVLTLTVKTANKTFVKEINISVIDYLKGDMNKDGKVNAIDASIVNDLYANGKMTAEDIAIGDMNDDGRLNSIDASLILDAYLTQNNQSRTINNIIGEENELNIWN